jgi:hypothetical protein
MKTYRELDVWQKAVDSAVETYKITEAFSLEKSNSD